MALDGDTWVALEEEAMLCLVWPWSSGPRNGPDQLINNKCLLQQLCFPEIDVNYPSKFYNFTKLSLFSQPVILQLFEINWLPSS